MYKFLNFVALVILLTACSNNKAKVSFMLPKSIEATEVTIKFANKVDSTLKPTIENNSFEVKTKHVQPQLGYAYVSTKKKNGVIFFFTEPNTAVSITIDSNLNVAKVAGGKLNEELFQFNTKTLGNWGKMEEVFKQQADMIMNIRPMARDSLATIYQQIMQQRIDLCKDYIGKNSNSTLSPVLALMYFGKDIEELKKVYTKFSSDVKISSYGKEIKATLDSYAGVYIGGNAPEFTLPNLEKKMVNLRDVYTKNKYTLIDFWASWCGPCRGENPNVVENYNAYKQKGLGIIGVSIDEDLVQWQKAIKSDNLAWLQVVDNKGWQSPTAIAYGIEGIPANFLVDNTGKIIAKNLRGEELGKKLNQLLK